MLPILSMTLFMYSSTAALIVFTTDAQDSPNGNDISDIFDDDELIVYSNKTGDKVDPVGNNISDIFDDDQVIEYSNTPRDKTHVDPLLETSNRFSIPKSKNSYDLDFEDWDMMNDNETTMFEEFNQTILYEMRDKKVSFRSPKGFTTHKPSRFTTPLMSFAIDIDSFGPLTTGSTPSLPNVGSRADLKSTTSANIGFTTSRPSVNSEEQTTVSSGDDGIVPYTDEPDYDLTELMKDPCNYERYEHPKPVIEKTGRRVSEIKCEEYMWHYKTEVLDVEKNRKKCDIKLRQNKLQPSQIFGGAKAVQGDFPHMGAVGWINLNGDYKWMCGSSLISPWFTLTAAHCRSASSRLPLKYREPQLVRFGSVFLEGNANDIKHLTAEDVFIDKFLVLDEYALHPIKKYNDIGLIKLKREVEIKLFIKPACLWSGFLGNSWSANVTGWGKTTDMEGSESKHLRYAEVDFVEQSTCKRYIHGRKNRHWSDGLKDHQFCAGKLSGGIDACQGDSGGPLQIRRPMPAVMNSTSIVHHVVGVTSFGIKCGLPLLPGVYTKVSSFLCWVEKNVWPEEPNSFCP